jgi:hypothetical protein
MEGAIPSSRSQILNVLSAEKQRISTLERDLASKGQTVILLMVMMGIGWILAAGCFAMWMLSAK